MFAWIFHLIKGGGQSDQTQKWVLYININLNLYQFVSNYQEGGNYQLLQNILDEMQLCKKKTIGREGNKL